jgi:hypothetical protein
VTVEPTPAYALLSAVTVGDLLDADDPAALLESLGCEITVWQTDGADRRFGVVHVPGLGWITLAICPQPAGSWGDPSLRLHLLMLALEGPLSAPVPIESEVPMAIAATPLPHRAFLGPDWLEGSVLRLLLARMPADVRALVTGLIALSHPEVLDALRALECWIVNRPEPGRTRDAQTAIGAAKIRRWPTVWRHDYAGREQDLVGSAVGHQFEEAQELLYHPVAEWDAVADRLVEEWALDPGTYLHKELARQSRDLRGEGPLDPLALR